MLLFLRYILEIWEATMNVHSLDARCLYFVSLVFSAKLLFQAPGKGAVPPFIPLALSFSKLILGSRF